MTSHPSRLTTGGSIYVYETVSPSCLSPRPIQQLLPFLLSVDRARCSSITPRTIRLLLRPRKTIFWHPSLTSKDLVDPTIISVLCFIRYYAFIVRRFYHGSTNSEALSGRTCKVIPRGKLISTSGSSSLTSSTHIQRPLNPERFSVARRQFYR